MDDADVSLAFDFEGQRYELSQRDMTASERLAWRQTLGMPFLAMLMQGLDVDVVAGVIWIIKRRSDPRLAFTDIADKLRWDDFDIVRVGDDGSDDAEVVDDADPTESAGS